MSDLLGDVLGPLSVLSSEVCSKFCSKIKIANQGRVIAKRSILNKYKAYCSHLTQEGQLMPTARASALASLWCLHMRDCAIFLRPVIILTSDSDSATHISYESVQTLALR